MTDAGGAPVAGAMVMIAAGTAPTPEIALRSRADGTFRLAVPDGSFRIEAHHPTIGKAQRDLRPDDDRCDLTLALSDER